jgi:hypothetical protein
MIWVVVNTYIGGMKQSFKCKEIVKKSVITSPEVTWDDENDDFTIYTHGKPLVPARRHLLYQSNYKIQVICVGERCAA